MPCHDPTVVDSRWGSNTHQSDTLARSAAQKTAPDQGHVSALDACSWIAHATVLIPVSPSSPKAGKPKSMRDRSWICDGRSRAARNVLYERHHHQPCRTANKGSNRRNMSKLYVFKDFKIWRTV